MPGFPLSLIRSAGTARHFDEFAMLIRFDTGRAILSVGGDVDVLAATTLGAVLDGLVDQGHRDVVLDLAALGFMGAAGLGVIAGASARMSTSGGGLTVRSAPELTRRILDITGMSELVHTEVATPNETAPGRDDLAFAVDGGTADFSAAIARVRSRPSDATIGAALRLVTALARATVEGADGVSVTLERHGRLATVASTNDTVLRMDGHQYKTGEGPCLAAAAEGCSFHIESLAEEDRWPAFVPLAVEEGIASILSTPLMTADRTLGALNIYSNTDRAFGTHQQELAALFATRASEILTDAGAEMTDEQMGERIADALLAREVIAQAQGVVMARLGITAIEADATLHRSARAANVPVRTHAAGIVASTPAMVAPGGAPARG